MWQLLDTGKQSAAANMELDAQLLAELGAGDAPLIHFYEWSEESATYGHFLSIERLINLAEAKRRGVHFARRPTGGGLLFHRFDFAFSVLVPAASRFFSLNTLANYHFINRAVKKAVQTFLEKSPEALGLLDQEPLPLDPQCRYFCMAKPTKYDVMVGAQKVAGAAQRRTKKGYLHQGSIALLPPDRPFLRALLLPGTQVYEAMQAQTFSLLGSQPTPQEVNKARALLKKQLIFYLTQESQQESTT